MARATLVLPVPLGSYMAQLVVPRDISAAEVEKLCAVLKTLPVPESVEAAASKDQP